jgi:NAD(P)-dependent dehydrogenase (short-subunit alcohol dehydrogenase family)
MTQLTDKVAFITGAGSGMGKGAARLLAREGAKIAALDRAETSLKRAVEEIQSQGGEILPLLADVSQPEQVQRAVEQTIERWGRIDIVFANAGINGKWAPLEELEPEDWDKTININLKGTFLTVKYTTPYLKGQGGAVVITSSVQGTRVFSNVGGSVYGTSKAGQVAFAKLVALELAPYGVRVNVICPGSIDTNIGQNTQVSPNVEKIRTPVEYPEGSIPLTHGKEGTPEDIAQVVLFLVSDASRFMSGTEIWIDGTESLLVG